MKLAKTWPYLALLASALLLAVGGPSVMRHLWSGGDPKVQRLPGTTPTRPDTSARQRALRANREAIVGRLEALVAGRDFERAMNEAAPWVITGDSDVGRIHREATLRVSTRQRQVELASRLSRLCTPIAAAFAANTVVKAKLEAGHRYEFDLPSAYRISRLAGKELREAIHEVARQTRPSESSAWGRAGPMVPVVRLTPELAIPLDEGDDIDALACAWEVQGYFREPAESGRGTAREFVARVWLIPDPIREAMDFQPVWVRISPVPRTPPAHR